QVMAVPGSLRNPAAAGTNSLLADGCAPVLAVDDVLTALGLSQVERETRRDRVEVPPAPSAAAARVLSACDDGPASIDR
ncbi:MAG: DNA-protecting protein DprA, partial [Acidimicrobiales bacterium]